MRVVAYEKGQIGVREPSLRSEMTLEDQDFLLYILQRFAPSKILEVGVSGGGTSGLLLKNTSLGQEVWGVDISSHWYKDKSKPVGWQVDTYCSIEEKKRYHLLLGKDIVERIESVGSKVDFCLLDTTHTLPGELLSFFAVFPFMSEGGVVCMHDISLNFHPRMDVKKLHNSFATRILWCSAGSKLKMIPTVEWPNIGAFLIDSDTKKNIYSTLFALGVTWNYWVGDELIDKYRQLFNKYYGKTFENIFKKIANNQKRFFG